uniref:Uncharacterized protein n=1 Tax=Arundo donax TaxID=35708 RepID=A0A0A9FLX4_ARUDO
MNKIKRFSRMRKLDSIWKLYLFFKLATLTMKARLDRCRT